MKKTEYNILSSPFVSHQARSLYLFELKPNSNSMGKYSIDCAKLISSLTVYSLESGEIRFQPKIKDLIGYLEELITVKLIKCNQPLKEELLQNASVTIIHKEKPLSQNADLQAIQNSQKRFIMHEEWRPSDQFPQLAKIAMLINHSYNEPEIAKFRCYWIAQGSMANESEWDYRFIQYLKKIHSPSSSLVPVYSENNSIGLQKK